MKPAHVPHEQLRTEAPMQKTHSDKYVTAFVSGENNVDMSFRNPVLQKSADHFRVGIDELTVNLSALSMLESESGDIVFRVVRRGYSVDALPGEDAETHEEEADGSLPIEFQMPDGPAGQEAIWRNAFTFKVDRIYNTMLEFMQRCTEIANSVGTFIRTQGLQNHAFVDDLWNQPLLASSDDNPMYFQHFNISLTPNGQLRFSGNKVFWANFMIEIPNERYRAILFNDPDRRFLAINPITNQETLEPIRIEEDPFGLEPNYIAMGFGIDDGFDYGDLDDTSALEFIGNGNIIASLDRRVTLEVGCSLPLKNSPMVDHGEESPDYVLGRYMFHQPYTLKTHAMSPEPELFMPGLGTQTLQGAKHRVCYHHLQPQQKIQNLRIRLWARVRTYDTATRKWGMQTIMCPTRAIDYWHIRLHFIEK